MSQWSVTAVTAILQNRVHPLLWGEGKRCTMAQNQQQALLNALKLELEFCELGGYKPSVPGRLPARAELVSARTALVNAARGLVKSYGERLPNCGTYQVSGKLAEGLSAELRDVLEPLLKEVESLNERIKEYDERMEKIAKEVHPEVSLLKQVKGVGTQIALTYVLTIEDPYRFLKSREVGCFLGLRPGRRNSGESEPQKRISKAGDRYLRTMMVQGAHYILGPFGEDSYLRRLGRKLAERGGKNAKKRAVVAVARKLAVLLHRLWVNGGVYEPLRNGQSRCAPWPREFQSEQL